MFKTDIKAHPYLKVFYKTGRWVTGFVVNIRFNLKNVHFYFKILKMRHDRDVRRIHRNGAKFITTESTLKCLKSNWQNSRLLRDSLQSLDKCE